MADTSASSPGGSCLEKLISYVKTQKGFILAAEILLSFIIIICYAASEYGGYIGLATSELVFAAFFFVIFTMELDKQIQVVNWLWTDLLRVLIGSFVYIIISFICLIKWGGDGAHITGDVLGVSTGVLMAYDTYTVILQIKSTRQPTAASTDTKV